MKESDQPDERFMKTSVEYPGAELSEMKRLLLKIIFSNPRLSRPCWRSLGNQGTWDISYASGS